MDLYFDKFKKNSRHCHQKEEYGVVLHVGKWQVRPVEVVVLYVELAFDGSALVVVGYDFLLRRVPVVGEDSPDDVFFAKKEVALRVFGFRPLYHEAVVHVREKRRERHGGYFAFLIVQLDFAPLLTLKELRLVELYVHVPVPVFYVERQSVDESDVGEVAETLLVRIRGVEVLVRKLF